MQNSPWEIKEKLLLALDKDNNVVDMAAVFEVISILEKVQISKEALELTRLGRYINELRRKTTNQALAKRAKDLVRRWRDMINPTSSTVPRANGRTGSAPSSGPMPPRSVSSGPLHTNIGATSQGTIGRSLHSSVMSPATSLPSSDGSASPAYPSSSSPLYSTWGSSTPGSWPKTVRGQAPESPKAQCDLIPVSDPVPKTHAENKRFRKSPTLADGAPPSKRVRPNGQLPTQERKPVCSPIAIHGDSSRDSFGIGSDHGSTSCEIISVVSKVPTFDNERTTVKKRGRKKGSGKKSLLSNASSSVPSVDDIVKEKIASIARTPKVKTTQELLEGLQAKTASNDDIVMLAVVENRNKTSLKNCVLPSRGHTSRDEVTRNKNEHITKFLQSQSEVSILPEEPPHFDGSNDTVLHPPVISPDIDSISCERTLPSIEDNIPRGGDDSVETILARLPPIDVNTINLDDSEPEISEEHSSDEVTDTNVEKLHVEHIEGINGNMSDGRKVSEEDDSFREWHEVVSKKSYQGELLHILPYVIID